MIQISSRNYELITPNPNPVFLHCSDNSYKLYDYGKNLR